MDLFKTLCLSLIFFPLLSPATRSDPLLRLPSESSGLGKRWAVLIAGSLGFENYRHQADICHAYHVLKDGGLKDENIIVFMYDDIAYSWENPRQGVIINQPQGDDVYAGVPKDYTGDAVNVDNFFAVLLGDKSATSGGSGKVVDSGPDDHIFIFYSDHGGPGVLGMPTFPYLYADDFISVLKKKHASNSYKSMVIYLEACESGSIFEGLLPQDIGIYATTASNAVENSFGTYCPEESYSPPPEYLTCLGDLYSISWLEDSDFHNLETETLRQQYKLVKTRTSVHNTYHLGSHVMQYGELDLNKELVFSYIGSNPANYNSTFVEANSLLFLPTGAVPQRDADLLYYWHKFRSSPKGSSRKQDAQKELLEVMTHRSHLDSSISLIGKLLFGSQGGGLEVLNAVRPAGMPLVDDWVCLKSMVRAFETRCGSLSQYGMKHMRSLANICNAGIREEMVAEAAAEACPQFPNTPWSSLHRGFSA